MKRERKSMKMRWNKAVLTVAAALAAVVLGAPMEVAAENVTSGTIRNGLQWTYDSETQTLVLTGEGQLHAEFEEVFSLDGDVVGGPLYEISDEINRIVLRDCTLKWDCSGAFMGLENVQYIEFENVDTSQVTDMSQMFNFCKSLTSLDLSNFDTSAVRDMSEMFDTCIGLTSLDLSNFDTSRVTDMRAMFYNCSGLTSLNVSNFDTSQVTNMRAMFGSCDSLTSLDVSSFDTSQVTTMEYMFDGCSGLTSLDLSNFDTSRANLITGMISYCSSLESLDLSGLDMSRCISRSNVLKASDKLEIIRTPKNMSNIQIDLPRTFYDETYNTHSTLNSKNCNTTLRLLYWYFITYHLDGGTNASGNPWLYSIASEVTLKDPTREGYTFEGWYSDSNFTTRVTQIVKGTTGKLDLYAKWKKNALTPEEQVKAFVERMYTVALGRNADPEGVTFWTNQLLTHEADGASLSEDFILSKEFVEKNYSDTDYLKVLYETFFTREADESGIAYWLSEMNSGKSRRTILAGFVNSNEFDELCTQYGIERGTMVVEPTPQPTPESGVQGFVERLYTICLERASEPAGLADWTKRIENGENSPQDVAKFFFLSGEYMEKGTSNDKYIETLYLVFMDRASEAGGKAYWVSELEKGTGREAALEGFAQSKEFQEIMERYGL